MPIFSYIAINNKGEPVNSTIDQPDRNGAISTLSKQGLRPISIKEIKVAASSFSFGNIFGSNKVKSDQLVMFTRQLSAMVGAGVPLLRALTALSDHVAESPVLKKILTGVIHDVEAGSTLGDALGKFPNTFNDVYVNMVRAGEAAGILEDILKRLALQQEKSMTMRKKIRSSMSYPVVLIVITVLAFFGLMIFVIPQIGKILTDLGGSEAKLPGITLVMLGISNIITKFWYIILGVIGAVTYGTLRYIKTKKGKFKFDNLMLRLPLIKTCLLYTSPSPRDGL